MTDTIMTIQLLKLLPLQYVSGIRLSSLVNGFWQELTIRLRANYKGRTRTKICMTRNPPSSLPAVRAKIHITS
jgi:hypothetical protein